MFIFAFTTPALKRRLMFLVIKLPLTFLHERFLLGRSTASPFSRKASLFEDLSIRCVRYAFVNIKPPIARVFFLKEVAWPFLRFRMLRHGYLRLPVHLEEVAQRSMKGVWMIQDTSREPDVVFYYAHGGGFSMGSPYFYLEFLLTLLAFLQSSSKFSNPAIFALDYRLVPEHQFPFQIHQALAGYNYLLADKNVKASRICLSGDSAGGTIMLSLLLHLANLDENKEQERSRSLHRVPGGAESRRPGMICLISPWVTLVSPKHRNTASDYLDPFTLRAFAQAYVGGKVSVQDPVASPGNCKDVGWWRRAAPLNGYVFFYGGEEAFAPDIRDLVTLLREGGMRVVEEEEEAGIHAWPVARLFLGSTRETRTSGIRAIADRVIEGLGQDTMK